jgi:hypothetical protein
MKHNEKIYLCTNKNLKFLQNEQPLRKQRGIKVIRITFASRGGELVRRRWIDPRPPEADSSSLSKIIFSIR